MNFLELKEQLPLILTAIFVIAFLATLWFLGKKQVVKNILYDMIIRAEATYGGKENNDIKYATVIGALNAKFPTLSLFIPNKVIDKWLDDLVQKMKDELGRDRINSLNVMTLSSEEFLNDLKSD